MPAVSEKQRRFMGAVMGAKRGRPASAEARKAADSMSVSQVHDFLQRDNQSRKSRKSTRRGRRSSR